MHSLHPLTLEGIFAGVQSLILAYLIRCLLRVFGVFRGCGTCKNHEVHGKHGIKQNKTKPFLLWDHHP
jgi:hypothetical protein